MPEPRFSVDTYFYFLGGMVLASLVAFVLLEHLPSVEQEHAVNYQPFTHNSGIKLSPLYTEETRNNQISGGGGVESFSDEARSGHLAVFSVYYFTINHQCHWAMNKHEDTSLL